MEVQFSDPSYDRLETDKTYTHNLPTLVVSSYRKRIQLLRAAFDEGDLIAMRMLGLKNLGTKSRGEYSVSLTDAFHLVFELRSHSTKRVIWITGVQQPDTEA
jgi:toxin HigB-1